MFSIDFSGSKLGDFTPWPISGRFVALRLKSGPWLICNTHQVVAVLLSGSVLLVDESTCDADVQHLLSCFWDGPLFHFMSPSDDLPGFAFRVDLGQHEVVDDIIRRNLKPAHWSAVHMWGWLALGAPFWEKRPDDEGGGFNLVNLPTNIFPF